MTMDTLPLLAAGSLSRLDYGVVVLYMLGTIAVGLSFAKGDKNTEDYLMGGRSIPWWLAGISYLMTLLSTISMVAIPGEAYSNGITLALQTFMLPVASLIGFHLFVRFYFITKTFTPFDYLEKRFDASIRAGAASFYWLSRVIYLGVALYATAVIFEGACGWPKHYTILLTAGIGVAYTILGGLSAVAWTDMLQFVVLVGGILVLVVKVLVTVPGGAGGIIDYAFSHGRGMPQVHDSSFYSLSPFVRLSLWGMILFMVNDHLFYNCSDQMALQRLLSTSNYRQARKSLYGCLALQVPIFMMLWFVGLCIFAYYGLRPASERPVQGDQALYQFIGTQLPAPLPGLMIAAMLAAVMSTLAGGFNSLTTVATVDFYQRFISRDASQAEQVLFSKWVTFALGFLSILMGLALTKLSNAESVVETSFVWLSMVSAVPPVYLLGIFSRRANARHAMLALLTSFVLTAAMIAYYLHFQGTEWAISFMYVCLPGPIVSLTITGLLTRFSPRQSAARLANLTLWTLEKKSPEASGTANEPLADATV